MVEQVSKLTMFTVYVLRSQKNNKRYVGHTSKESLVRLKEHNCGHNKWARTNKPFILIHTEDWPDKTSAIKRENFLKSGQGRKWLDENIDN